MQKWFSVKTVYLTTANGKPRNADRSYRNNSVLCEERVVLFKARNFAEAIRLAEKDAKKYAAATHVNVYGQKVVTRYAGCCEAFELFDPPGNEIEVFSSTEVLPKKPGKKELADRKIGLSYGRRERSLRRKFLNREFTK